MSLSKCWFLGVAGASLLTGCGDDMTLPVVDAGPPDARANDVMDPVVEDSGGSPTNPAEAGVLDAGKQFPDFLVDLTSNLPGLRVVLEHEMGLSQVRLSSSNLEALPEGGLRWFAELRNGSHSAWCNPNVVIRFLNGEGATLWEGDAEVRATLHVSSSVELLPCIAGETTTVVWAVDLEAPLLDLDEVQTIGLRIGGDVFDDTVPHPATPQLEDVQVIEIGEDSGVSQAVRGGLRGATQPVNYAAVEAFVKNEQGFIFEVLRVAKTDPAQGTLRSNELWQFQTEPIPHSIASFQALVSFEP